MSLVKYIFLFIILLLLFLIYIEEGLLSPLLVFFFFYLFSYFLLQNRYLKNLYLSSYFFYSFCSLLVGLFLINDPSIDYFYAFDNVFFYSIAEELGNSSSFYEFIIKFNQVSEIYYDTRGWNFLTGMLSYFSGIIDRVNYYSLSFLNPFIGSLSILVIYKVLVYEFGETLAKKYIVPFLYLSFIPIFSSTLLRDLLIALLFFINTYLVLTKKSYWFFWFIIVSLIIYTIRPESAFIVFGLVTLYYRKYNLYYFSIIIIAITIFSFLFYNYLIDFLYVYDTYKSYSIDQSTGSGFGSVLFSFPIGVREILVTIFSQIQPFPWSTLFQVGKSSVFGLYEMIIGIFHFFSLLVVFYVLIIKGKLLKLNHNYIFMLLILFIFLIGSIYTFSHRRSFCLYLGLYINFFWSLSFLNKKTIFNILAFTIIILLGINVLYEVIK